jgi:ATP-dependent 26S proteasome regulatory subunit
VASETPRDGSAPPPPADVEGQQWAIQRRLGEIFGKLGEKLAELTGRVDVAVKAETSFADIAGLAEAKGLVRSFVTALTDPELYGKWGIAPPKGMLIYGPPGTGKTLLARALATEAGAVFYHLRLGTLTSKFGPNTGELLQEVLGLAREQGKGVVLLDQADALALEHLLPPAQAREAGARIVAALCEKLDTLDASARLVVIAATSRTDAVDPSLVAPGRLDHLVEVRLPDAAAQQQVIALTRARAEHNAGRPLVGDLDYRLLLPPMGGMSGGEIRDIVRRALEEKVHAAGQGQEAGLVTTQDLLRQVDVYRRIRAVVEKIRYGQYL